MLRTLKGAATTPIMNLAFVLVVVAAGFSLRNMPSTSNSPRPPLWQRGVNCLLSVAPECLNRGHGVALQQPNRIPDRLIRG